MDPEIRRVDSRDAAFAKTEHVFFNTKTNALECLHCGTTYLMVMPISVTLLAAVAKAFTKDHRGCRKPKADHCDVHPEIKLDNGCCVTCFNSPNNTDSGFDFPLTRRGGA